MEIPQTIAVQQEHKRTRGNIGHLLFENTHFKFMSSLKSFDVNRHV